MRAYSALSVKKAIFVILALSVLNVHHLLSIYYFVCCGLSLFFPSILLLFGEHSHNISVTRVSMTKPRSVFSIYLKILWNHTQLLILLATFRFDWPLVVKRFLTLFQAVSDAPQELFSFECLLL